VDSADLVFLDPNNGIQGTRLTPDHAALAELAALKRQDRVLVVSQRQSGHQSHTRTIADRLQMLGCERIELIRFRLVSSRFYVVADHDEAMSMRIASFAKKWGNWVKTYRL
jgi:methylmalonyl-CoA mutase cobalamin-binding subunit